MRKKMTAGGETVQTLNTMIVRGDQLESFHAARLMIGRPEN